MCGGVLHEPLECPTKKKLDLVARATGGDEPFLWGAWKHHHYYASLKDKAEKAVVPLQQ